MRRAHLVDVDYDSLASYLFEHYRELADDNSPFADAAFLHYRGILREHADKIMDGDLRGEDGDLMGLLFKHYHFGVVEDVIVTNSPGYVTQRDGELVMLPLILIEVNLFK